MTPKIAIFASGSGSNAEQITHYFRQFQTAEIALIISNKADAFVFERAKRLGIPTLFISGKQMQEPNNILPLLQQAKISFIVLAGYLLKIPDYLIQAYPERIVNIHPALLPKYGGKGMYGMNVHQAVVENKDKESGITIHYVSENYDEGAIIFQASCPITPEDTPETVAQKVHELEYKHFPETIERTIANAKPDIV